VGCGAEALVLSGASSPLCRGAAGVLLPR
jgi:hypothetical protein